MGVRPGGRIATLLDPLGTGQGLPVRMPLRCRRPEEARRFYREALGTTSACAEFRREDVALPGWELVVRGSGGAGEVVSPEGHRFRSEHSGA
ncbi:hypothetical protein ACVNF4_02980 [Streptomyces sp. S6]